MKDLLGEVNESMLKYLEGKDAEIKDLIVFNEGAKLLSKELSAKLDSAEMEIERLGEDSMALNDTINRLDATVRELKSDKRVKLLKDEIKLLKYTVKKERVKYESYISMLMNEEDSETIMSFDLERPHCPTLAELELERPYCPTLAELEADWLYNATHREALADCLIKLLVYVKNGYRPITASDRVRYLDFVGNLIEYYNKEKEGIGGIQ